MSGAEAVVKRTLDVLSALAIGALTLPALLVCWAVTKLSCWRASALFRQARVGLDEREFVLYKLRTMIPDAEKGTGPMFSPDDDPRVTGFGRLMRRFHLDELPQLWNILRGDMSLVGPRPERPHFVEQFAQEFPRYRERHRVKPGLTGWAQVMNRADIHNTEKKLRYDLEYADRYSLWLDFRIVLLTVGGIVAEAARVVTGRPRGMRAASQSAPSSPEPDPMTEE
jgi:lipopolysaccharide/colanic/teichoic acid biosynthesis glycosyltransferase